MKKEILRVLYKMKFSFMIIPVLHRCQGGFCRWLFVEFGIDNTKCDMVLYELETDYHTTVNTSYWYESYERRRNIEASIIPRIDHLNRTIARLENEIKKQ